MDKNNLDEINIEYGSHNVFADLSLDNADELLTRAHSINGKNHNPPGCY